MLLLLPVFFSCNDKLICPAYTSYFILDNSNADLVASARKEHWPDASYIIYENDIRDKYFSYVGEDSMPRTDVPVARKDQYGIIEKPGFLAKKNDLKMIPMEVVMPESSDSVKFAGDAEFLTELDHVDSTAVDSVSVQTKTYKYNVDQKYYLWYFRNKLKWKDEMGETEEEEPPGSTATNVEDMEQPKEGFFKRIFGNLFKKKDKEVDPATEELTDPPADQQDDTGF